MHLSEFAVAQFSVLLAQTNTDWIMEGEIVGRSVSDAFLRKLIGDVVRFVQRQVSHCI